LSGLKYFKILTMCTIAPPDLFLVASIAIFIHYYFIELLYLIKKY
jgi:hypothetical protein